MMRSTFLMGIKCHLNEPRQMRNLRNKIRFSSENTDRGLGKCTIIIRKLLRGGGGVAKVSRVGVVQKNAQKCHVLLG